MINTINMQDMRYMNLFEKITGVSTRFCFKYNDFIVFIIPASAVSRAIGENGKNIKRMSEILGRKIKVVPSPNGNYDIKKFIENIVNPATFRGVEIGEREIIVASAGTQSKAALMGRDKKRLYELQKIAKDFLGKELKVI